MNKAAIMDKIEKSEPPVRQRILLIDDRRDSILPVQRMLELDGHEVISASTGPEGVALALQFTPDVILCDIGLPGGMSGYDVARAIRADPVLHAIYLVALSGYGLDEHRQKTRDAGFDNHVTKPITKEDLEELVAQRPRFRNCEGSGSGWPGSP